MIWYATIASTLSLIVAVIAFRSSYINYMDNAALRGRVNTLERRLSNESGGRLEAAARLRDHIDKEIKERRAKTSEISVRQGVLETRLTRLEKDFDHNDAHDEEMRRVILDALIERDCPTESKDA